MMVVPSCYPSYGRAPNHLWLNEKRVKCSKIKVYLVAMLLMNIKIGQIMNLLVAQVFLHPDDEDCQGVPEPEVVHQVMVMPFDGITIKIESAFGWEEIVEQPFVLISTMINYFGKR